MNFGGKYNFPISGCLLTWLTVRVIVVFGAVRLGLAVSLAQPAGVLDGAAAALLLVVTAPAPLVIRLGQGQAGVGASLADLYNYLDDDQS